MLKKAENNQQELIIRINKLNNEYNPRKQINIKGKTNVIESAKKFYSIRKEIINVFKRGIFPYKDGFWIEEESEEEKEKKQHDFKKFIEHIENESKRMSYDFFTEYFKHTVPSVSAKELYKTRNRKKNSNLVNNIKNTLRELKEEIKNIGEDQKRI